MKNVHDARRNISVRFWSPMSSLDMARKKSVPNKNVQQSKVDEISSKNERITRHSKRLEEKKISAVDHTSSKNRRSTRQNKQKKEKTAEIETKIEPLVESEAVDTLSSIYKCKVPSCQNLKPFSSLSSLNQHNRVKHEGIRWICPFCQEEQSSKYSQERHIKRHHNKNYKGNPDQNQYELGYRVKMTEKAKDVLLGKLVEKVEYQDKLIDQLKNRLRAALTKLTKFEGKSTSEPKTDGTFYSHALKLEKSICLFSNIFSKFC